MSVCGEKSDDEYSVIGDKGEVGFIDFDDDSSVCSYDPNEEGSVFVSVPFPFVGQKPRSVLVDAIASDAIIIKNRTRDSIEIWGIQIYASNPEDTFELSLMEPSKSGFVGSHSLEDRVLPPHKTMTVWLSCKPKTIGMQTCIVHLDIEGDKIERVVFLLAEDSVSKALASNKPYFARGRKKTQFVVDSYVQGVRPAAPANRFRPFHCKLLDYLIPKDIREVIESKQIPDAIIEGLSRRNYVPYFKTLVIMEELRLEEDMKAFDMENATMRSKGRLFLVLEVVGLAEKRPSLVHGDAVFAKLASEDTDNIPAYEGFIHRVEADHVYLKFADTFHQQHKDHYSYNIRFMYNRVNMRRLYQAIEAADKIHKAFLFPTESLMKRQIKPNFTVPISLKLNEEQMNAVEMILGCKGGVPYMINGPPGTGKTMTLVEAILQIYRARKGSRILICAASNCAADHILEKILKEDVKIQENEIFRLNASSRPIEDMKPEYMQYCFFENSVFRCLPREALRYYRIIITTYMSSALLHTEGIQQGHFSHIILDEAGQASEPETMVPIANFCRKDTVVVLAGDPMQLGPVVFSHHAKKHGLGKSYLERLFECEIYSEGDEGYVTTLRRNYRSHPEILKLPSELFYRGELISCQEPMESTLWQDLLPNKEFPMLFTGIQAYDEREGDNPSWFNRTEASMVVKLIKKLISNNVTEESIGVITPYRQQVAKIKMALENDDIHEVKIGSVEQFQGQERDVIIISTVRSTVKHDEFDRVHYLGFLSNPKRFNVAITRARSLLVIIGNPHIICKDRFWARLLWRCVDNNSYEGCSLPERGEWDDNDNPMLEYGCSNTAGTDQFNKGSHNYCQGQDNDDSFPEENGWSVNAPTEQNFEDGWSLDAPVAQQSFDDGWSLDAPVMQQNFENGCSLDAPAVDENSGITDPAAEDGQKPPWEDDFPKPVKDEDEWSDGWK
ncbi:unnamed protein product [Amaranthus hypochondriacus]